MNEVDDYTTTEGKVENGNVTITNTHVPVIPEEPEDPKTTDVTFSKVEVNGSAELPGASLKVVSGETADGQIEVKGTDGSWTVQADAIIKMEDAKTPVIPEKNSQIPQQLMIQQLCQVILINNQRRNKKRNHSFRQQEIAAV
ncbi:hypothetical protein Si099_01953 [Streptococcus infantarius subsp. infantarius]|nr:hypothetical protein [Streptococcus infantarius subsp. infantarius]